jgi:hypothetical protein
LIAQVATYEVGISSIVFESYVTSQIACLPTKMQAACGPDGFYSFTSLNSILQQFIDHGD